MKNVLRQDACRAGVCQSRHKRALSEIFSQGEITRLEKCVWVAELESQGVFLGTVFSNGVLPGTVSKERLLVSRKSATILDQGPYQNLLHPT
jgi:hypothetical protein